jgi:predicted secreted protein
MAGKARVGRKIKFRWGTPAEEIPGVREKGVACAGEAINVTADDSGGWRELLEDAAENQVEITLSGVTKSHRLEDDFFAGNRTKYAEVEYENGRKISGTFFLASHNTTGVYNDAVTFEATLQSTGVIAVTPGI